MKTAKIKLPLRIGVLGALGRMGHRVCSLASQDSRFQIAAKLDRRHFDLDSLAKDADILVDFSTTQASLLALKWAAQAPIPIVIGVTGFSPNELSKIRFLARKTPVFLAPNFSPGVFLMKRLVKEASSALPSYDISILETHHKMKKDAPSGTAKELAAVLGRKAEILSQRIGDIVGEHSIIFAGPFERLEITHRAHSRDLFARGALEAALWLYGKKPGLYGMADLLNGTH